MKITRKTPLILINVGTGEYSTGTLESMKIEQMPVCTQRHFINEACKLFERVTPNMRENPMYQDAVNWYEIENDLEPTLP